MSITRSHCQETNDGKAGSGISRPQEVCNQCNNKGLWGEGGILAIHEVETDCAIEWLPGSVIRSRPSHVTTKGTYNAGC